MKERIAQAVVRREMAPVAIFLLESSKPLARTGSQLLIFCLPVARLLLADLAAYRSFIELLEDPEEVEGLIQAIERAENERLG